MTTFRTIVLVAGLVGLLAGLLLTGLQAVTTVPLILQAETYEDAAAAHSHEPDATAHDHGEGWAPREGIERLFFTGVANVLTGVGFALLIGAAGELRGGIRSWRQGVFWGLAGFAAFTLAPGLGLPPELPAMPAGELVDRQVWWLMTVALTAGGLALFAFGRTIPLGLLGLVLIVAPHAIGAPQPDSFDSPVPHELARDFVVAAVATSFVFWVVIGGLTGILRRRFASA